VPDIKRIENKKHLSFYYHNTLKPILTFALSLYLSLLLFVVAMSPGSVLVNSGGCIHPQALRGTRPLDIQTDVSGNKHNQFRKLI